MPPSRRMCSLASVIITIFFCFSFIIDHYDPRPHFEPVSNTQDSKPKALLSVWNMTPNIHTRSSLDTRRDFETGFESVSNPEYSKPKSLLSVWNMTPNIQARSTLDTKRSFEQTLDTKRDFKTHFKTVSNPQDSKPKAQMSVWNMTPNIQARSTLDAKRSFEQILDTKQDFETASNPAQLDWNMAPDFQPNYQNEMPNFESHTSNFERRLSNFQSQSSFQNRGSKKQRRNSDSPLKGPKNPQPNSNSSPLEFTETFTDVGNSRGLANSQPNSQLNSHQQNSDLTNSQSPEHFASYTSSSEARISDLENSDSDSDFQRHLRLTESYQSDSGTERRIPEDGLTSQGQESYPEILEGPKTLRLVTKSHHEDQSKNQSLGTGQNQTFQQISKNHSEDQPQVPKNQSKNQTLQVPKSRSLHEDKFQDQTKMENVTQGLQRSSEDSSGLALDQGGVKIGGGGGGGGGGGQCKKKYWKCDNPPTDPEPPLEDLESLSPPFTVPHWTQYADRGYSVLDYNGTSIKRLPHVLIIGAKKSGTRALLAFLKVHPNIKASGPELHYFDRFYHRGLDWYRSKLPLSLEGQLTVEKTPAYFTTAGVPARVKQDLPGAKLLLVVRDPVTRALSDYTQSLSKHRSRRSFEDLAFIKSSPGLVNSEWGPISGGLYARHLQRWLHYFPKTSIHIISGENLIRDPAAELCKVQEFLGLRQVITEKHFFFNVTKGFPCLAKREKSGRPHCLGSSKGRSHPQISLTTYNTLRDFYRPFNFKFYKMVQQNFRW